MRGREERGERERGRERDTRIRRSMTPPLQYEWVGVSLASF